MRQESRNPRRQDTTQKALDGPGQRRVRPSRRLRKGVPAMGVIGLVLAVAGCGSSTTGPAPAPTSADSANAGKAAVAFATALFDGELAQAEKLVQPDNQKAFGLVAAGLTGAKPHANGLADGKTVVTGDRAVTTLLGDLCRAAPSGATSSPADCISNHDPSSSNPIFKVATARQPNGGWLVTISIPGVVAPPTGSGASGQSSPTSATSPALPSP